MSDTANQAVQSLVFSSNAAFRSPIIDGGLMIKTSSWANSLKAWQRSTQASFS
jgi:hypothetical protein